MGERILAPGGADYSVVWSARGNALLKCPVFEVFFGGARGGGKTDGMLGEWAVHADRYGQNAIRPMLRRTPHRVDRDDRTLACHLLADGMEIAQHRDPRLRAWRLGRWSRRLGIRRRLRSCAHVVASGKVVSVS
jgi:hypothetical protein